MTRSGIEQFLEQQKLAFARRDIVALTALHTDECTFDSPAYGVVQGRDAIREVYAYWYRAFPDFLLTWERSVIDPPHAAYFWTFAGTAEGPFFGEVRAGTKVQMIGATENKYSEQGIIASRHVFDFSGTLVRAGVLKMKPS